MPLWNLPFRIFSSRLPFRMIWVFSRWYDIMRDTESRVGVYSSIVPIVTPLKTSILHHCWRVSILNIVASTTSWIAFFSSYLKEVIFYLFKYEKSYILVSRVLQPHFFFIVFERGDFFIYLNMRNLIF